MFRAQKAVLNEEQLKTYEGIVVEKQLEREIRQTTNLKNQLEENYPGIDISGDQIKLILEKKELAKEKYAGEKNKWKKIHKETKVIYKEVMTERQYNLYEVIEKEKKATQELIALTEIKKAYPVVEQLLPLFDEFTLTKMKTLRKKLEAKISEEDKRVIEELRATRKQSFDQLLNDELYPELNELEVENQELARYIDFFIELFENNLESIVNLYPEDGFLIFGKDRYGENVYKKYFPEIKNMEAEILWVIKETVKKGAVIVSEEYPIPPVSMILSEIKDVPEELMELFLLLDPEVDFSIELPNFEGGEGKHFASAFPNPAKKNQTLEFYLQNDANVVIEILDETGRTVQVISNGNRSKGKQTISVDLQNLDNQIYFYRITNDGIVTTLKFSVVK